MTKIDIISGFLGAGKTTLIKKLLSEAFAGEQVVLIDTSGSGRATARTATMATNSLSIKTKSTIMQH